MSSSLKDLRCIAVCTEEDCSETKAVMPLTHRIGRLQNHHIFLPTDEPSVLCCSRAPQVVPTKEKDPEMWAAVHIAVLRKHHCLSSKCCGQAQAVNHIRKIPVARRRRILVAGGDIRQVADKTGVLSEWKATEAEMQTLADRADVTWQVLHDMV